MKNLKPFDLQAALSGKAVMLRNGEKAFVRHYETELPVGEDARLMGYLLSGSRMAWCENGHYYASSGGSDDDIIGMYPETRIINGFEVPAPERVKPKEGSRYFNVNLSHKQFYDVLPWNNDTFDNRMLERGLVFLNKDDVIANAKAMLGINPYSEDES